MNKLNKNNLSDKKRSILLAVILFGSFLAILNQTLMLPALAGIMRDMNVNANTVQWLTTGFMLVNGIMIPITAFLINRFTNRRLFIGSMCILTIGSLVGALAVNFQMLLLGRLIQAVSVGIIMPMMQTLILYMYPKEKRGYAMGLQGITIGFAPAIGPTLAGFIIDGLGWHYIFWLLIPLAIIDIIAAYFLMPNLMEKGNPKLDVPSIIMSTVGCGGVLYGCSIAGSIGWSEPVVFISIIVGLIGVALFAYRQLHLAEPFLVVSVLKNKSFFIGTVLAMVMFGLMIAGETLLPLYTQNALGHSALTAGLVLLPGALLAGIFSPVAGNIFDKYGPRILAITGTLITVASSFAFLLVRLETSLFLIATLYAVRIFGLTFVTMPVTTWALNCLEDKLIAHGTSVTSSFRQIFGSIITALIITAMTMGQKAFANPESAEAMLHGFHNGMLLSACLAVGMLIISLIFVHDYEGIAAVNRDKKH